MVSKKDDPITETDQELEQPKPALASQRGKRLIVVGIGASAGGLEALKQLLPGLPEHAGQTYVIVQHLDPKHRSLLVNLLSPMTEMEVLEAADKQKLKPDTIYITPSGHDLVIQGERLYLKETTKVVGPKPSVDMFFTSLAEELGEQAVGIILSGTGSDGAHGIRAIKGGGGITIAQQPETAKYDGMPRAAMDTGNVDLVMPPEKMGPELLALMSSPLMTPQRQAVVTEPDAMSHLLDLIQKQTGADFSGYKSNTLDRRVARRVALHKLANLRDYLAYVEQNPEDLEAMTKDILISVTSFFRDEEAFQALGGIIPSIMKDKRVGDSVRVWVPGCATGDEAYSIALLFAGKLGDRFERYNFNIFGTDIDADAIAQARRGMYSEASLVHVDQALLERYFRRQDNFFQVVKSLRECIVFAKQDLIHDPPFSRLDLIACRNLLIYLNSDLQRRIIPLFHYALNPKGYLFLGKSESIGPFNDLFDPVAKRWRIFQRKGGMRPNQGLLSRQHRSFGIPTARQKPREVKPSLRQITQQAVAEAMDLPAVVIDERLELVHVLGNVGQFLSLSEGDAGLNILDLASYQIRATLRAAIHKANREQSMVVSRRIRWQGRDESERFLNLYISPIKQESAPKGLTLIMFEQSEPIQALELEGIGPSDARDQRIVEVEQELAANREHLQTTTEELETANEELQSLNEELQSANEELQSTNEELETSNEELQATNEELTTVNEELAVKSQELSFANSDLENILARMGIPLVAVDLELRVRRFTPPATSLFNLVKGQRGQVITTLGTSLELPGLGELLNTVIASGESQTLGVESSTRSFEMRIFPYVDEDGKNQGAILTFYDQTEVNRREQEFRALVENAPDFVARFNHQLKHLYVNQAMSRASGHEPKHFIGKTNQELGLPAELGQAWDKALRQVFASGEEAVVRLKYPSPDGLTQIETRIVPEYTPGGRIGSVLAVGRDITPLVEAEIKSNQAAEQMGHLLDSISDGFFSLDDSLKVTFFNQAAGRLLGRKPDQVTGRPILEAFPEAKGTEFEKKFRQALSERQALEFETHLDKPPLDDWYHVRVYPYDKGITVYFRVVTREKLAQKQQEQLESQLRQAQKMEAVGTLAGGIAHDFNNILAAISGYAEMALDMNKQQGRVENADLEGVMAAVKRASELVRNILAFSRESGVQLRPLDVNREVGRAVDILKRTVPKMIDIHLELSPGKAIILGNSGQIQQVILNLGSNARDAMPDGGKLRIKTQVVRLDAEFQKVHPGMAPGEHLQLTVTDTGPGIDQKLLDKVFDPFFTTKEVGSGTGLGLATVYGIVTGHKGHITCRSDPDQGTRFDIYLPLTEEAELEDFPPATPVPREIKGNGHILVVDDDVSLRIIIRKFLENSGYKVSMASSGEEALGAYRKKGNHFDLVILDLGMPGMGGHKALKEILGVDPKAKVLIASGYSAEGQVNEALEAGAIGFITKPWLKTELLTTVHQALNG